jgi:hypothetical protein
MNVLAGVADLSGLRLHPLADCTDSPEQTPWRLDGRIASARCSPGVPEEQQAIARGEDTEVQKGSVIRCSNPTLRQPFDRTQAMS